MQIAVQTMTTYEDTLRLAQWCETNEVASLAVADHYLSGPNLESPALDQLVLLGGIARETSTLRFCTLVSPLTFRHPATHLKAAVTLDAMSGGRFSLGVGTGWMKEEHDAFGIELYSMKERFDRLEETLSYLRAGIDGSTSGFAGTYYQLEAFDPRPTPANLAIVVGGGGAMRTPDLAGRFADEFNIFPAEASWSERIDRARSARAGSGRTGELFVSTAFPALIGSNDAEAKMTLEALAARYDRDPDELSARYEQLGVPHGSIERVREGLGRLVSLGVKRVYLQTGGEVDHAIHQTELFMEASRGL